MARPTEAARFCAAPDALMADFDGATQTIGEDDRAEIRFADGSVASTAGDDWRPMRLADLLAQTKEG